MSLQYPLSLASSSPRRRELLTFGGWTFSIAPADIDETPLPDEEPRAYVLRMAEEKAIAARKTAVEPTIILASDTTVADGNMILGKPETPQEATNMLTTLRNRVHQVHTAIAVTAPNSDEIILDISSTDVPMRNYSDDEIAAYVASGDPFDKAGGYAIQNTDFYPVRTLTGCKASVMGLPVCHVVRAFAKVGLHPTQNVPATCQAALTFDCNEYPKILDAD